MEENIYIDGSLGEGGGQVLRTSLALSMITGKSLEISNIRAKRKKPGLLRQHLTCVKAAAEICDANTEGAELGSAYLKFYPNDIKIGEYTFKVGSAGSAMLVFQTILTALMLREEESIIHLEGGTHNPMAPPFHFIVNSFLPQLSKMGVNVTADLDRWVFYPAGGGKATFRINGTNKLKELELLEKGSYISKNCKAISAHLIPEITEAEVSFLKGKLDWDEISTDDKCHSLGPGNIIYAEVNYKNISSVFCEFGQKGIRASKVAQKLVQKVKNYISSDAPVEEYLADQLLLPMALAEQGAFHCSQLSLHTKTNIDVIKRFLEVDIEVTKENNDSFKVVVKS